MAAATRVCRIGTSLSGRSASPRTYKAIKERGAIRPIIHLMLSNSLEKVKEWCEENKGDLFIAALIFMVGLGGFGLGRLSVIWSQKEPITITDSASDGGGGASLPLPAASTAALKASVRGKYVASKSGAYYHLPWCAGALRIKDANKIWFQTKQEAEQKGYKPASNCPGL